MLPIEEVQNLLSAWEEKNNAGEDVTPTLNRLAEVFELEYYNYLKTDPDPLYDSHPNRSVPECTLGHMLKTVFKKQRFVDEMVNVYCQRDAVELNTAVCRVLLDILPGLENIIFQTESFVLKLYQWAETAPNPLQTYATGLLANAMNIAEVAGNYREKNTIFIPLMLQRLHTLSTNYFNGISNSENTLPTISESLSLTGIQSEKSLNFSQSINVSKGCPSLTEVSPVPEVSESSPRSFSRKRKRENIDESTVNETSNSNWTEYRFGSYQLFPLTISSEQKYILEFLTPLGEYQEFLAPHLEANALLLILRYIDFKQHNDVRLAFAALKYLAALLCHKKVAFEFLNVGGLRLLLKVPRFSIAADGVSLCLYYLGTYTEVLEKISLFHSNIISEVISYALWMTECSHNSSRFHAIFFFSLSFAFKPFLQQFDRKGGLRTLFNTMTILDIFTSRNNRLLNDDDIFTSRQTARHVCTALKKYFEAHVAFFVKKKTSRGISEEDRALKAISFSNEAVEKNMEMLHDLFPCAPFFRWEPITEFLNLNGITFLLELIASYFEINYSARAETIKCALDVLKICALTFEAGLKFCEKISEPEGTEPRTGICVLLEAAVGEKVPCAEAQRSALLTIANLVHYKHVPRNLDESANSSRRAQLLSRSKDAMNKICRVFRIKNGINVLINLLFTKEPFSEADSIRFLACKALYGLANAQNVKQIICKLPLITDGQLINLMKEPVLQDKLSDHVQFCKYGLKLIQKVAEAPLAPGTESSLNLDKLRACEVVAKTKIVYPPDQLLQLINDHLIEKGFTRTSQCLQQEIAMKSESSNTSFCLEGLPNSNNGFTHAHHSRLLHSGGTSVVPPTSIPLKIMMNKKKQSHASQLSVPPEAFSPYESPKPVIKRKPLSPEPTSSSAKCLSPAILKRKAQETAITPQSSVSLDSIIIEFLRKQHALCKNPMLSCPPFDLTVPHKCPEPQKKRYAPTNFTLRQHKHEIFGNSGGFHGAALNRKLIHSRFRLLKSIRDEDSSYDFASCAFIDDFDESNPKDLDFYPNLLVGTDSGNVKLINILNGAQLLAKECVRSRIIDYIETRKASKLFICTALHRIGYAGLYKILPDEISEIKIYNDVNHLEFGKMHEEKMIASKYHAAAIYDMRTLDMVQIFPDDDMGNGYVKNRATFNYTDDMVLSDGLLYDVRSGTMIHKLDQFNAVLNGVFHPNNREIISNSEIWDIRTFKLLQTVSGFDQCRVSFDKLGNVIYAVGYSKEILTCGGSNSFSTFHAHDYSTIATVDVKKPIFDLALDMNGTFIATCESKNSFECRARVYEVGRSKQTADERDDDDEDDDEDNSDDSGEEDENSEASEGEVEIEFLDNDDDEQANDNLSEGELELDSTLSEGEMALEEDDNWVPSSDSSDDDMEGSGTDSDNYRLSEGEIPPVSDSDSDSYRLSEGEIPPAIVMAYQPSDSDSDGLVG